MPGATPEETGASCTRVIGFSQTKQWFPVFEEIAGSSRWELLWNPGGAVERWAEASYPGWDEPVVSPCGEPDRVLLTISGRPRRVDAWERAIREAVDTIRRRVPSAAELVLQPVVGGPANATCAVEGRPVRASVNHPDIDEAIDGLGIGTVGASPEVRDCSEYADGLGHLTEDGSRAVATGLAAHYG